MLSGIGEKKSYIREKLQGVVAGVGPGPAGLHSSTSQLNLNRF